jgi:hypothetical protein
VTEFRLRRHVGESSPFLEPGLAKLMGDVEEILVRRTEASGALRRADDDVARLIEEAPPALAGADRVLEGRDGVRVSVRSQARYDAEVVPVAGCDDQVVVAVGTGGCLDLPCRQVQFGRLRVDELDVVMLERRCEREREVGRRPLSERQPDERRVEDELVRR